MFHYNHEVISFSVCLLEDVRSRHVETNEALRNVEDKTLQEKQTFLCPKPFWIKVCASYKFRVTDKRKNQTHVSVSVSDS